jgi:predicted 3-demethylubiquinone-9 3-methyltransferase (glyoxalase superfamily)
MPSKKRKVPARKPAARKAPARRPVARKPRPGKALARVAPIAPCLWFDGVAEEAARYYVSIFPKGRIKSVSRFPNVGREIHGGAPGSVLAVEFELNGQPFLAMNGGPRFKFNLAVSLQVLCQTQAEIDYYWEKLREGGDEDAQQCGWLKDKYGLSWQVTWSGMPKLWRDAASRGAERAFAVLLEAGKLDIAALKKAYKG